MSIKLIIFGRPGSGKSAAARYISKLTQNKGLSAVRVNDYNILLDMYHADSEHEKFLPTTYVEGGFDIIDFSVLKVALTDVERLAQENIDSKKYSFIILELARADYVATLKQFNPAFLQGAYFLLIYSGIKTCIDRVNERTAHPVTPDDHYVSDRIMKDYYQNDNLLYIPTKLASDFKVPNSRIRIISNTESLQTFIRRIDKFIEIIAELKTHTLPETDPVQDTVSVVNNNNLKCEQ
jgi:adenylate kinase family enzyme